MLAKCYRSFQEGSEDSQERLHRREGGGPLKSSIYTIRSRIKSGTLLQTQPSLIVAHP